MDQEKLEKGRIMSLSSAEISALPEYKALLERRRSATIPLAALVTVAYFVFILMVAYKPHLMGHPLGGSVTVGIVYGLGLIFLTMGVTAWYVGYANRHLEPLLKAIQQKAGA